MSRKIDQRIVEMSFENHKFEKGILESKNSLKEFSNALKNTGTGKSFNGLEDSIGSISRSFSMMEQIGIGALRRIGEMAINATTNLARSLSVDQLTAGLSKYQEKIEAVQTMVSAGYNLDEVEESMERLMWFSDETSYSFSDMAGNMAKFIAAGVDLKVSERAMQGIATWAAHSGKNSTAASIAMFNLSQAISMGYVDTMNWRSIMNQNMNTKMFKEIAIGVAEATGAIEKGQVTIQNFDSNLRDKWFTNDVLLRTLEQYSGYAEKVKEVQDEMGFDTANQAMDYMEANADKYADVLNQIGNAAFKASQESKSFTDSINATKDAVSSGWLKTYEIIFGTLDEAKANFSSLTEILWTVFASGAEGRNAMLQSIKDLGGVADAFQTIKNVATALLKPLKSVSKGFDQIFPPKTVDQWMGIIGALKSFSGQLIITDETANKIQRTFAGLFAVIDIGWTIVKFLGSAFLEIVQTLIPVRGGFLDITASLGDFLVVLNHAIKTSGAFQYGLLAIRIAMIVIKDVLTNVIGAISNFINILWTTDKPLEFIRKSMQTTFRGIIDLIKMGITWISNNFINALSSASKFINDKFGSNAHGAFSGILGVLGSIVDLISNKANSALGNLSDIIRGLDLNKIASFVIGGTLLLFVGQITQLTKSITGLADNASGFLNKFSKKLFGSTTKIKDMAYTIGVLTASLFVLSRIPWEDLKKGLIGVGGALAIFVAAYAGIQAVNVIATNMLKDKEMIKSAFNLVSLASGLAIMAGALKVISDIDDNNIWRSVGVIGALVGFLTVYQGATGIIGTLAGGKMSVSLLGMASGLLLLIGVVKIINNVQDQEITDGMGKIRDILIAIGSVQLLFSLAASIGGGNKLATSILGMASGILILVGVIKLITNISNDEILTGMMKVSIIAVAIAAIQALFATVTMVDKGKKASVSILAIAGGVTAMLALIKLVNLMTSDEILMGTIKISFMMGMLAVMQGMFAAATNLGKGNVSSSILAATVSMATMTGLIAIINVYTPEQIQKGISTLAQMAVLIGAIQLFTGVAAAISDGNKSVASIISITVLIASMTGAIALLSVIPLESLEAASNALINGAIAVGVIIAALSIFSYTAQNSIPQMLGLAASLVIFAGAIALMAIPIMELSKLDTDGLTAGVVVIGSLIGVFAGLTVLFDTLNVGTASLIGLAASLVIFGAALTLLSIPMSVLSSFDSSQISTTTLAFAGLLAVFTAMGFLNTGGVLAMGMLTAAGGVAAFGASLIVVAAAITLAGIGFKFGAEAFDILVKAFTNLLNTVEQNRDTLIDDFKVLGTAIGEGVFSGIKSFFSNIGNELKNIWATILTSIKDFFGIHSPSTVMTTIGGNISDGLWNGLKKGITNIKDNIGSYLSGITDKISGVVDSVVPVGKDLVNSIGNGIKRNGKAAILAGINMAQDVEDAIRDTFQIHSESPLFAEMGKWVPDSIAAGFQDGKAYLLGKAADLGIDTSSITIEGIAEGLANGEGAITNGITSLLDLLNGKKSISEIANDLGIQTGETFSGAYSDTINGAETKAAYGGMAKDAFQIFKEGIDYRKEYNLISLSEELAEWENFSKKYTEGTEIRMKADKELARVRAELDTKSFDNSKRWIDEEKYYKRLSLLEELAAWERVQKRYAEGHAYRMQAERELFRLKEEIKQAEYQNSLDWIDEEKYYKRLSLLDEFAAWTRVQSRYEEGTEYRKKSDREIFRLEKEISETNLAYEEKLYALEKERNDKRKQLEDDYYNKTKEIKNKLAQDIKSLEDEYENAVASRAQTLYSTHGLFDKVEKPEYVSGFDLINNLEDQVMEFDKWQSSIATLADKGIDDGLISELRDMGPKSLAQIRALNRMTKPELDRYVTLWSKKNNEAKTQAVDELSGLKDETSLEIKRLTREADKELDYYNKVWKDSLKELNAENKKQLQILEKEWKTNLGKITAPGIEIIQRFRLDWFGEIATMIADTNTQMSNLQKATQVAKAASSAAVVGASIGRGLGGGIIGTTGAVIGAAASLVGSALTAMKQTAKTNSPSKEGIWIGEYIGIGLADGLHNTLSTIAKEGTTMGQTALDSISMFMEDIPDLLDDSNSFTIQPVLDLTNVGSGLDNMSLLLNDFPRLDSKAIMQLLPLENGSSDDILLLNDIRDTLKTIGDKEVDLTGMLTVQVINDKGEIVSIAQTAIKDMLRRESR